MGNVSHMTRDIFRDEGKKLASTRYLKEFLAWEDNSPSGHSFDCSSELLKKGELMKLKWTVDH